MEFQKQNFVDGILLRAEHLNNIEDAIALIVTAINNMSENVGIDKIEQTTTSDEAGGVNIITITLTNGEKTSVVIRNGSQGSVGPRGVDGKDGKDGYTPVKGVDYVDGKNGRNGTDGKSAYQYALEGGFVGTEADFTLKMASKDFADVQFDEATRFLRFMDANGNDVYDPVYIAGGGGGGGTVTTTDVKLVNESGFNSLTVAQGEAVELSFRFTSLDDGEPTGNGTCKIIVDGVLQTTFSVKQGSTTVDVTKYLKAGSNTVRIICTDVYGNYKLLDIPVSVIDLRLTSTFDDTVQYNDKISFKYIPYGEIEKTIHVFLDGTEIHTVTTTDTNKQTTVTIPAQSHGIHKLEAYITATLDEQPLESDHLIYDVICTETGATDILIASVYETKSVSQGQQVSIPYSIYNPASLDSEIELIVSTAGGVYSTQGLTVDRGRKYWNVRNYPIGEVTFTIKCGEVTKSHALTVTESDLDVDAVTNDLELYLTSVGRSNLESNPAKWEYDNILTEFTNVNWNSTGWIADDNGDATLRLNGGAKAEISFKPFEKDWKTYGKTLEIEFAIRDVNNRDAVVISCMDETIGFKVTADTAVLKSEQSEISCNFCDEERIRITFVVESRSEYRLMMVYLNGILSGAKQYPTTDNFQQNEPMNITIGSEYCGIDLYTIRSYTNALTFNEVIDNCIYDIPDIAEKVAMYEANNLYDAYGKLKYEEVKKNIPVMTIVGDLPQSKGDKKDVRVIFEHNTDSTLNFDDTGTIDVQGTSSQWYIRKNYKEKLSTSHLLASGQMPTRVFCTKADYAESTGTHNTQNANLVETLYSEKTPAQKDDNRCRTTIYGYPIVIFHQASESSAPVFIGKYNFNFDKGSEEVYGFNGTYDVESWEFLNNTSDACNFLAPIGGDWKANFEARYPEEHQNISRFKEMHDWVVSTKGNVEKFKAEFENYFDLHFALIYYVYTSVMLMVDQRAKNMFLTYWGETGKWQPWFYDNDTCLGINNEGNLVFDYYHEDIDTIAGAKVYNGQSSTLWNNFREAFADEIKECYQGLRNNGKLTYEKVIEHFVTNGSDKWSASIYNEDSDYKYISMLRSNNDASNLYQVRGTGEEHLKYFIKNRLNYYDSKWYASDYANNYATLRIYTPDEWAGVEPNADITIVPFSNMYAGVRYKANGELYQQRVSKNEEVTFVAPNEKFSDTETAVYGASEISSLGDLAPLYCGTIKLENASRLVNLKIGDATEGYSNPNLVELLIGTNRLLKTVDIRNCPNLVDPLGLRGCPNIEEIYATGSGITGIDLADSGYLKVLHLPGTLTNLTLKNQLYITDYQIEGYDNLLTLNIENCPAVDALQIMDDAPNLNRVRVAKADWSFDNATTMLGIASKGYKGVDENGDNVDTAQISGKCHIKELTGTEYKAILDAFPYMTITYETLVSSLIFMSEDGLTEYARQTIVGGGDGTDPTANGMMEEPAKESTAQYAYVFAGWSTTIGGSADSNALKNITSDRYVYAAFTETLRYYNVYFYNGTTLLQTANVPYGGSTTYTGDTPVNNSTGNPDDFKFKGWNPNPINITGETYCYAVYEDNREITDTWATVASNIANGTATSKYGVGAFKNLEIGKKDLPYDFHQSSAVVYNGEIHIMGSYVSSYQKYHYKWNGSEWVSASTLPIKVYGEQVVVYNNEIHMLGGSTYDGQRAHYKWDGSKWTKVSTLPYAFMSSSAVVYNGEIHILGSGNSSYKTSHYKWNETDGWVSASTLPYQFSDSAAVVYNNEIHIFGANNLYKNHYKWNGTEWTSVGSSHPNGIYQSSVVVYNNEIHVIGSRSYMKQHHKWDGTQWTSVSTLPYNFKQSSAVIFDEKLYIMGSSYASSDYKSFFAYSFDTAEWSAVGDIKQIPMQIVAHNQDVLPDGVVKWEALTNLNNAPQYACAVTYQNEVHVLGGQNSNTQHVKWDATNSAWITVSTLPYNFRSGSAVVMNDEIHILGSYQTTNGTEHYKWNGTEWVSVSTLPYKFNNGSAVVLNNEIHILGSYESSYRKYHYKWNGTEWVSVSTLSYNFFYGSAVVYNNEIHILGANTSSYYNAHYKWNGSAWESVSTLPYNFYYGASGMIDNEIHIFGGYGNEKGHYKWNGTSWVSVSTLPAGLQNYPVAVCDNAPYVFASTSCYKLNTENPKATLTFVAKTLLSERRKMNTSATNNGGWSASELRTWLNGDFLATLPADIQTAIVEVKKLSDGGSANPNVVISNDKIWLPSVSEITTETSDDWVSGQGSVYSVFTDDNSRIRTPSDEIAGEWWTRSSRITSSQRFANVNAYGEVSSTGASNDKYILIGFCL